MPTYGSNSPIPKWLPLPSQSDGVRCWFFSVVTCAASLLFGTLSQSKGWVSRRWQWGGRGQHNKRQRGPRCRIWLLWLMLSTGCSKLSRRVLAHNCPSQLEEPLQRRGHKPRHTLAMQWHMWERIYCLGKREIVRGEKNLLQIIKKKEMKAGLFFKWHSYVQYQK